MNLYESLIKNVGIGKEVLVRQWIKNHTRVNDPKSVEYKNGKISYNYLDLYLEEELPDYIAFDNVKHFNIINMSKRKLKLNPAQLPEEAEYVILNGFDLTNTTLKLNLIGVREVYISDCICKNTVIDAPYANLLLYNLDSIIEGISSKNATGIQLTDLDMAKLISKLKGDIDGNVRKIFKKFPKVEKITCTSFCISKAGGKWILD